MAYAVDSTSTIHSPNSRPRSRRTSAARTATLTQLQSTSRSSSRSRRSRRERGDRAGADDTIKVRTARHRAGVPAFESESDEPVREGRGRGRSREVAAPKAAKASPAGVDKVQKPQSQTRSQSRSVSKSEGRKEMDYSADLESETDMDDGSDLFFGDFCFTCGAPIDVAPSSPSTHAHNPRGYCSEVCEQAGTPALRPRRSPFGIGLGAGLTMSPYDSPAIPAFGRSEDEYSTSPSSTSSAHSPSPYNAIGHHQLRLSAHDEPTVLSLPQSITSAHAHSQHPHHHSTLAKSMPDSTPTHRKLNFDYAYALSNELEQQEGQPTESLAFSMPAAAPEHIRRESFGLGAGGFQSVDSMLRFKRRSVVATTTGHVPFAEERPKSAEKQRPRQSRKSSISSLLSLGPAASAVAATTLSHAHRDSFDVAPISPAGSPGRSSTLDFGTSPLTAPPIPSTLPASPTMVKTCA